MAVTQFTKAELLAQIENLVPALWLDPIKNPGPGYEILQAYAAIMSRCSLAAERLDKDLYVLTADEGQRSDVTVQVLRTSNTMGDVYVRPMTLFRASVSGRLYMLRNTLSFTGGTLGPLTANLFSIVSGYEQNAAGRAIAADGEIMDGDVDQVVFPLTLPEPYYPGLVLTCEQLDPGVGGAFPALEALGEDRGMPRKAGEPADIYRQRLLQLPDTVSPDAIHRAVKAALYKYTTQFSIVETWQVAFQTAYDCPAPPSPSYPTNPVYNPAFPGGINYDPTCFFFDDTRTNIPWRNRVPDDTTDTNCFAVVMPNLGAIADYGMSLDDPAMSMADLKTPSIVDGRRCASFFDMPFDTDPSIVLQCFLDGMDLQKSAVYTGLYNQLQEIKAAGETVLLVLND